ncbi:MAG: BCCT family transporter [Planctomycetaceae bacterium]|nr:BCCT family transporter [Planctomycetaceae bacterium]
MTNDTSSKDDSSKKIVIQKGTFWPTAIILVAVLVVGIVTPKFFNESASYLFTVVTEQWGQLFLIMALLMFVLCIVIAFTPFGKKKLGGEDAKPEHPVFSWCAMAICSGIATAMVFFAVGEPLTYFHTPPAFTGLTGGTPEAAVRGVMIAAFHWSFIYYGMFAFWGLAVGYMSMNYKLPYRPSSALYPILRHNIYRWPGKAIDVLSVLALIGGIVSSLGFGTTQFASGLDFLFDMTPSNTIFLVTILLVTISYTFSSARGLNNGMRVISNMNAYIYIAITVFLIVFGPTVFLADLFTESLGSMIMNFVPTSLNADPFNVGQGWSENNTVFFMAWILAYAPLIGMFLAKISKGRTIRAYLLVNIFVPGLFVFIWFTAFGGNAIYQDFFNAAGIIDVIREKGFPIANFALLQHMPLQYIIIPLIIACLFFSFITLADAMTGTISSMTLENAVPDEAPRPIKLFWGLLMGATTLICLFALGEVGTLAMQCTTIIYALPIVLISIPVVVSVLRMVSGRVDRELALNPPSEEEMRKKTWRIPR